MSGENKKIILLVEDEIIICMNTSRSLDKYGYTVITANTGEKAIETVNNTPWIDLILMDIDLGSGIDGSEAAKFILQNHDIPIVFLSSHTEPEIVTKTEIITSYGYVVKNTGITVLDASIKMAFKLFEANKKAKTEMVERKQNESAFLNSQKQFNEVLTSSQTASYKRDLKTDCFTYLSPVFTDVSGYTLEELKCFPIDNIFELIHPDDIAEFNRVINDSMTGTAGSEYAMEYRFKHKNGCYYWVRDQFIVSFDENGRPSARIGSLSDISDQKLTEEKLVISENKWRNLFEVLPVGVSIINADCNVTDFNQRLEEILGITKEGLQNKLYSKRKYLKSNSTEMMPEEFPSSIAIKEKRTVRNIEIGVVKEDGKITWTNVSAAPLPFPENSCVVVASDITEKKMVKDALEENKSIIEQFLTYSPSLIYIKDEKLRLLKISKTMEVLLGRPSDELLGKDSYDLVPPEFAKSAIADDMKVLTEGKPIEVEEEMNGKIYSTLKFPLHRAGGLPSYIAGFSIDITKRKLAEKETLDQLIEKETLLKEVHHRIKNNIYTIESLLTMQSKSVSNSETIAALQDAAGRVSSMRVLYDKLLISDEYNDISVKTYLESLIEAITGIFTNNLNITINKYIEDFNLSSKKMFPLGIILNELLTNIMKHAFTDGGAGLINISLSKINTQITLTLHDNGKGLQENFDINTSKGFGLILVKMLSKQLGGTFAIENDNGTKSILNFEL